MSMMDFMLDRRSESLSSIVDTFDATHIISTEQTIAFHYTASWFKSDKALQLFDEEVAILRSVRHPWLLTPHDVIEDDRERLLCYKPFKHGDALSQSWGKLDDELLLPLFEGLSEMAAMFHMKGAFCYFDPAELFVSSPLGVKWLRLPRAFLSETSMPASSGIFGSPGFRSPGQVRGDDVQPADDFFVLGAMLLAAKTGREPFSADKSADALKLIADGQIDGLDDETLEPGFKDLIERLMRQDEDQRLTDPDDIYERLQVAFGKAPFVPEPDVEEDDAEEVAAKVPSGDVVEVEVDAKEASKEADDDDQEEVPHAVASDADDSSDDVSTDAPEPSDDALDVIEEAKKAEEVSSGSDDVSDADVPTSSVEEAAPMVDGEAGEDERQSIGDDPGTVPLSRISTLDINRAEELLVPDVSADASDEDDVSEPADGDEPVAVESTNDEDASDIPAPVLEAEPVEKGDALEASSEEAEESLAVAPEVPSASLEEEPEEEPEEEVEAPEEPVLPPAPPAPAAAALTPPPLPPATPAPFAPPSSGALTPPPLPQALPGAAAPADATEDTPVSSESKEEDLTPAEQAQIAKARRTAKRQEGKKRRKKSRTRSGMTGIFAGLIEEAVKADQESMPVPEEAVSKPAKEEAPEAPEAPEAKEAKAEPKPAKGRRATVAFGSPEAAKSGAVESLLPPPLPKPDESQELEEGSLDLLKPIDDKSAEVVSESADAPVLPELPEPSSPALPAAGSAAGPSPTPPPSPGGFLGLGPEKGVKFDSGVKVEKGRRSSTMPLGAGSLRRSSTKAADTLISPAPVEVKEPVLELPPEFDSAADLDAIPHDSSPLEDLKKAPEKSSAVDVSAPASKATPSQEELDGVSLNEMADIDGDFDEFALDASIDGARLDESPVESTLQSGPPPTIEPMVRETVPELKPAAPPSDEPSLEAELPLEDEKPSVPPEPILPSPTEDTVLPPEDTAAAADTAKAPAPQLAPQNAPKERKVKVLRRKGVVRYYKQMNPMKIFPLLVTILEAEKYIKVPDLPDVVQKESDKVMQIKETSPMVRIVPVIPGCLVSPAEAVVDVRQKKVDTEFWVAPQNVGDLQRSARVQIWHEGELKDEIQLPIRVKTQTLTKVTGSISLFSTFGGVFLKAFGSGQPVVSKGVSTKIAQSFVGFFSATGMWVGLLLFFAALGCYFWLRPKEGDKVEMFLNSELH